MEDWTRVLLYGTFDGFTYSTDDLPRIVVVLDDGERVEVPKECVISADQMVNKNKIKLKDVIARIKNIDLDSQELWLNEILNKLGSDYGSLKYRAGYEQGKFDCAMERDKVTVPQFVADWYEECKENLEYNIWNYIYNWETKEECDFKNWLDLGRNNPIQTLINMHQFGYTIEKEKRYRVKMKGIDKEFTMLKLDKIRGSWYLGNDNEYSYTKTAHTHKELEEAGFGEVFDSPLFEVEEVEE
nr:MAG TPA: Protein of unknown function (DUF1642) [Caudoviricetes sp.]